jgi:hypothetical protein
MSKSNIKACVNNYNFLNQLITSNFSSVLIVFPTFFTWISLGDADLCFSLMLESKANAVEEETT